MSVDFNASQTKVNLMKAFAGESQARNRYTFAAAQAKKENLHVIEAIFTFTANQEKEHAEIFYKHLKQCAGQEIAIDAAYPVDMTSSVIELLKSSQNNEFKEHNEVYKEFAKKAQEEGFENISESFSLIGEIEKHHGDRFAKFAKLMEEDKLFVSDVECDWICLNCGHILNAKQAPQQCSVCQHPKGFFIRLKLAPFDCGCNCQK